MPRIDEPPCRVDAHSRLDEIDAHFARRIGCPPRDLIRPGTRVRESTEDDRPEIVAFERGETTILQVPSRFLDEMDAVLVDHRTRGIAAETLAARLAALEPHVTPTERVAFLDERDFHPVAHTGVRALTADDGPALTALHRACPAVDQRMANINIEHPAAFGCFVDETLAAAASFIFHRDDIADVGVLVHPEFRRRSLGAAVVSALSRWGLAHERLVQYCWLDTNPGSGHLAERVGFRPYAAWTVLRLGASQPRTK